MSGYLLPTNDDFVDVVAKAIAKNRIYEEASSTMEDMIGVGIASSSQLESTFEAVFDALWNGHRPLDERQRSQYRTDARAAISAINLKLLTTAE